MLRVLALGVRDEWEAAGEIMAIGWIIELAQYLVYSHGHMFEWWDVRDDAIGIAGAFLLLQIARRVKSATKQLKAS